jgi:CHAT domain-containing protein
MKQHSIAVVIVLGLCAHWLPALPAEEVVEDVMENVSEDVTEEVAEDAVENVAEDESILGETPGSNPVELLQCAYDAKISRECSLSLEFLKAAKAIAEESQNKVLLTHIFIQLSDLYLVLGQRNEAEGFGYKALEMASDLGNLKLLAASLNNWGNILIQYDGYNEAIDVYDESFILAKDDGDVEGALRALINLVQTALRIDELETAYNVINEAKLMLEEKLSWDVALSWQMQFAREAQNLAGKDLNSDVREELNQWAEKVWQTVASYAEQQENDGLQSRAYGNLGITYENKGNYEAAIQFTRRALFFVEKAQIAERAYELYWQIGRLCKKQERRKEALAGYLQAVKELVPIQGQLLGRQRDKNRFFREKIKPLYYELAELYVELADKNPVIAQEYLKDSRLIIEKMKKVEIQNLFNDECVISFNSKVVSLDQVPAGTALFYPLMFPEKLVLLVAIEDEIFPLVTAVDAETFTKDVYAFRRGLQNRSNRSFYKPGARIYDAMIRPMKAKLEEYSIDTLVIVPDGVFSLIPFSPLFDLETKEFLIEQYAVATSLGMELADPNPLSREAIKVLLLGLSESVQDHSALPSVPKELERIQSIFPEDSRKFLNEDFVYTNVVEAFQEENFRIIHMATHGEFGHDPDDSYLLTYAGKLNFDKLEGLIKFSKFRDNPVELLILSACRTAVGDERAALGLAGVAVKSGARSAIASLWYIDDEASMLVISQFYRELVDNPEFSKAQALQAAQLKLIQQKRYWHPSYWSAFLLIGNWL